MDKPMRCTQQRVQRQIRQNGEIAQINIRTQCWVQRACTENVQISEGTYFPSSEINTNFLPHKYLMKALKRELQIMCFRKVLDDGRHYSLATAFILETFHLYMALRATHFTQFSSTCVWLVVLLHINSVDVPKCTQYESTSRRVTSNACHRSVRSGVRPFFKCKLPLAG